MIDSSLLAEAAKQLPGCDYIVDLYDLTFVWASSHALSVTGYTMDEILQLRNLDIADEAYDEVKLRAELNERIATGSGEKEYVITHRDKSKIFIHYAYKIFYFHDGAYLTGKLLETHATK